ncbi:MAG: DHH family phosphoesterase, partial [Candidatus Woesearchaeota archaeon]
MISYEEIREKLQTCENPLIFFDDDADGVCSFLLIYKYLNKGHGVIVKSTPEIKADPYIRKITEYMPDLVIILDKPKVEDEFLKGISCDVIWIDHHEPQTITQKNVYYYNPEVEGKQKPTTA